MNKVKALHRFFNPIIEKRNLKEKDPNITGLSKILIDEMKYYTVDEISISQMSSLEGFNLFEVHVIKSAFSYFKKILSNSRKDLNELVERINKDNGISFNVKGEKITTNIVVGENFFLFENYHYESCFLLSFSSPWKYGFPALQLTFLESMKVANLSFSTIDNRFENQFFIDLGKVFFRYKKNMLKEINNRNKKIIITNYNQPHVGHNIWNGLSGWGCLNKITIENSNCLAQSLCYKMDLENIPFEREKKFDSFDIESEMPFFIKSDYIDERVSAAIKKESSKYLNEGVRKYNLPFDLENKNIVLINLRTGNRTNRDNLSFHKELIVNFIYKLDCIVIIDGMNTSEVSDSSSHKNINIIEEVNLAKEICSLNREKIYSIVGCTIEENLAIAAFSDIVIAPWGAGLAKYSWICNLDCIVYSSSNVLRGKSDLHLYSDNYFFKKKNTIHYIPHDDVIDIEDSDQRQSRWNFDLTQKAKNRMIEIIISKISMSKCFYLKNKYAKKMLEKISRNKHKKIKIMPYGNKIEKSIEGEFFNLKKMDKDLKANDLFHLKKSFFLDNFILFLSEICNEDVLIVSGGYYNNMIALMVEEDGELVMYLEEGDYKNVTLMNRLEKSFSKKSVDKHDTNEIEQYLNNKEKTKDAIVLECNNNFSKMQHIQKAFEKKAIDINVSVAILKDMTISGGSNSQCQIINESNIDNINKIIIKNNFLVRYIPINKLGE